MVTSWDIAREASVSQTTVSRVVNGDRRVARETRQRVEEAIARLGYTPNGVARGLATRRTLKEQRVDGLIVTSALIDSEAIHTLAEERFPFVLANRYVDGVESDVVT